MKETHSTINVPRETSPKLFWRFLKFGLLAWGGPVAQIAMIRQDLVEEEKWISQERFNRVLAVYQVLPGPEATELCVYFGMLSRGRLGAFLAGLGFILPGFMPDVGSFLVLYHLWNKFSFISCGVSWYAISSRCLDRPSNIPYQRSCTKQ
jgi:chromate transporter